MCFAFQHGTTNTHRSKLPNCSTDYELGMLYVLEATRTMV